MGKLFLLLKIEYYLATLSNDTLRERLHVHVIRPNKRDLSRVNVYAKIWIEKDGVKNLEVAYNTLDNTTLKDILTRNDNNYDLVKKQVIDALSGNKVKIIKLK